MSCAGARRLFGAYWDDEITLAERDWLESHFAGCAACRDDYEQFARAVELLGSLPRVEVQPDLAERVLARARRTGAAPDRLPLAAPRWVPITATAALLTIAATMTLLWLGVAPPGRTPESAQVAGTSVQGSARPVRGDLPAAGLPEGGLPATTTATAGLAAGVPDSLFDHSADVEFILDPVVLRKGRAHTVLKLNPGVQGEKAVITF